MLKVRSLLWRIIGEHRASRQRVAIKQLRIPRLQSRTVEVPIPVLDELAPPTVTKNLFPPISSPSCFPIELLTSVRSLVVPCQIEIPRVHGKILRSSPDMDNDDDGLEPLGLPFTLRSSRTLTNEDEEPYLTDELYALLLPPTSDLVGITFSWPAELYPFQIEGVKFLIQRRHALLADDMGLGKTIQAIAAIRILLKAGWIRKVLVVCPASIKTNWLREFKKWAPEITCKLIEGNAQERKVCWALPCHVLITNYRSLINDYEYGYCDERSFDLVVLDEAQKIKNPTTKTSRTAKALQRRSSWCLTGTPIENSEEDIKSIFEFVHPQLYLFGASRDVLRRQIAPYFLRRRKQEVLSELPPKIVADRWLTLTPEQQESYTTAEREGIVYLRDLGEHITIQHVFALITRLKQICNFDPGTKRSCKLDYLREMIQGVGAAGEKAIVFSQFVDTLSFLEHELSQFSPLLYHGGLSTAQKSKVIRQFADDPDRPLLLISLKAGGLGLNLQVASWVFHYDRWWTPAVERQAEDRAHRIGQTRSLMIERLMCQDTIEERIHQIQERKKRIIDSIVEADYEEGIERLSPEEIFEVVGLDPELAEIAMRKSRSS